MCKYDSNKNHLRYIKSLKPFPCVDCGRLRYCRERAGKPEVLRCRSCAMKIARKGKASPNKGRIFSLEHCQRLSEVRKRYFEIPENRRLQAERMKGLQLSNETRKKISESMKLVRKTTPAKGGAVKGSTRAEGFRYKQSVRMLGTVMPEDTKAKISKFKKMNPQPNYFKSGKDNIMYGKQRDATFRRAASIRMYKLWQDEDYKNRVIRKTVRSNAKKPNIKEMALSYILRTTLPHEYRYNGDARRGIIFGGRIPDFVSINGKKSVILLHGIYWHLWRKQKDDPQLRKEDVEQLDIKHYNKYGYDVLVVWEDELEHKNKLKQKIYEFAGMRWK